ncbi:MAG: helix-turn-helix domain-containing protein [Planctomycetaceae bacterium]|nr:helix-turn-helix domain-containing protein [Planctomycetaceae bacterium]
MARGDFSRLAKIKRRLIQGRPRAGLAAAWPSPNGSGRIEISVYTDKSISVNDICQTLKISRATLYRYLHMGKKTTHES